MTNLLAREKSPYLLQHADNPVAWQPWGPAALAQAQAQQKPIFLSIGYSTCHWCHVMAHESFENPAVAAVLNRDFIPVKVDREERPDLDRVYMTYVQQTTGHGGWPMSVWLTPEGKPFFGGTYFPPDDRHGRAGFITVLNAITRHWAEQRAKILSGADEVVAALQRYATEGRAREVEPEGGVTAPLHEAAASALALAAAEAFEKGFQYFYEAHDSTWGGFGGAPKFPRASIIHFLYRTAALQGVTSELGLAAGKMAERTLQKMAEGGLHDHLGGGFHRYSVDEEWFVPHFEKMLYDQAQIALNYLEARQASGREVFAWVARGIFDYVRRDLTGPHGGFYSAEDADSPLPTAATEDGGQRTEEKKHAEGAFYVWSKAEIDRVLGDSSVGGVPPPRGNDTSPGEGTRPTMDSDFFCTHYGVKAEGNVAHDPQGEFTGKNILRQRQSLVVTAREHNMEIEAASARLLDCLERLRQVRTTRPRPQLDDKVITAWNGLMISALAKGSQVLECRSLLAGDGAEESPASRLLQRGASISARPEDSPYLRAATRAAEFIRRELYDPATGVLYRSWRDGRSVIAGFAEDYAYLIQGLLDLYETGFEIRWLQWAVALQAKMDELFWDSQGGGYFNSRADDPTVIVRLKEDYDGAEPAPNSVAALNLVRLEWMIGDAVGRVPSPGEASFPPGEGTRPTEMTYAQRAELVIETFRPQWGRAPHALPQMLVALEMLLAEPRTVVLTGDPTAPAFRALVAVLHEKLGPRRSLLWADQGAGQAWLAVHRTYLADIQAVGPASAYLCENGTCRPAVMEPADFRALLG